MFGDRIRHVMRGQRLLTAPPATRVAKAAQLMAERNVGAILVVENNKLLGIFTERDVVFRVVAKGLDATATSIREVMTPDPKTAHPDDPFEYALVVMHEGGFRHLPVIEDGKPVGIVSSRSAMDPELEEFASETSRRQHFARMAKR